MSKKEITTVYTTLISDQGKTFGDEGLNKEAHMGKKMWDNEKS